MNMIKAFLKENLYLLILWALCLIGLHFFVGHYSNILLDVGREVYYPQRILEGKVLYKDLFNIYGPFSYLFNAGLFKIFGVNLKTFYIAGYICAFFIVTAVFLIAKNFLSKFLSFAMGIFTIATGICTVHLFNYTFPYSWGMLYGTVFSLYSLFFLIKFCKEDKKVLYLYLSSFLGGCAVCNKYDFILFTVIILAITLGTKNIKTIIISLFSFVLIPVLCFSFLFFQGLTIGHLLINSKIITDMINTDSLKYFYQHSGVYFSFPILIYWIINFIKSALCLFTIAFGLKYYKKNNELCFFIVLLGIFLTYFLANPAIFSFLIGITVILFVICFKTIKSTKATIVLILSTIALSLKSFWGLTPLNYGNYYCVMVLIAFCTLFTHGLKKDYQNTFSIFLLVISLWFGILGGKQLSSLNYCIETKKGEIFTSEYFGKPINETIKYFKNNKAESFVIFPEGLIINFLCEKTSIGDDFYNSLLPLYVETFGEKQIIEHFEKNKPYFIVFNNLNMQDYNKGFICKDYALDFCGSIYKNYLPDKSIGDDFGFYIFKKAP